MANSSSQAAAPMLCSWGKSLGSLSLILCCLIKTAILCREQETFFASPIRSSSVPKSDIGLNCPSHKLGSAGALGSYGMTSGEKRSAGLCMLSACMSGQRVFALVWVLAR